uniref:Uncharacterized protein n=1 Tax=Pristionchus pacificus TaxID=54126 RepID=A0A2A6B4B9_PRIPA|eukprot:PDM60719.1 hypothetical protein PRIPAC_54525 [Pristionchus pacificus]
MIMEDNDLLVIRIDGFLSLAAPISLLTRLEHRLQCAPHHRSILKQGEDTLLLLWRRWHGGTPRAHALNDLLQQYEQKTYLDNSFSTTICASAPLADRLSFAKE